MADADYCFLCESSLPGGTRSNRCMLCTLIDTANGIAKFQENDARILYATIIRCTKLILDAIDKTGGRIDALEERW